MAFQSPVGGSNHQKLWVAWWPVRLISSNNTKQRNLSVTVALRHCILKLPFIFVFIPSSCLSYVASKNQLKWLGTKDELFFFLSSQLGIDNSDFQVHDNGTCSVFKAEQITCNFYTRAKTLQIQGKENAEQLKLNLVALANEKLTRVEVPSVNEKQYGGEFEDPHLTVPLQTTTYHQ